MDTGNSHERVRSSVRAYMGYMERPPEQRERGVELNLLAAVQWAGDALARSYREPLERKIAKIKAGQE